MADVFISYSRKDDDVAEALRSVLQENGLSVWWDANLYGGARFEREIENQLKKSACVIVLWSRNSLESNWVQAEARVAYEGDRLVPLAIEYVDPNQIPFTMRDVHVEDISRWVTDKQPADLDETIGAVRRMVSRNQNTSSNTDATVEVVFMQAILMSENIEDWQAYLAKFPNGQFRDVAQNKIKSLRQKPPSPDVAPAVASPVTEAVATPATTGKSFPFAWAASAAAFIVLAGSVVGTGPWGLQMWGPPADTKADEKVAEEDGPITDLAAREQALIDVARQFGQSNRFSDSLARNAINAAGALSKEEIETKPELISALETILDSFFSADRFDFVSRIEAAHGPLLKEHAEFYVSFCLSYGLRLIETERRTYDDLWSIEDQAYFERNLAKYREYATLDVVRQRFPEYELMYEPFILKLEGATDEQVLAKMRRVSTLRGDDLNNFTRVMERYATSAYARDRNVPSVVLVRQRVQALIRNYAADDPSGEWRKVGLLANVDLAE